MSGWWVSWWDSCGWSFGRGCVRRNKCCRAVGDRAVCRAVDDGYGFRQAFRTAEGFRS